MNSPAIVIVAILAVAALYVLLPRVAHVFARYRDTRFLPCPDTGGNADISIDAPRAAFTSALGRPRLRVKRCSLWPARRGCGETCLRVPEVETY